MAITIDWGTRIISVPKADTLLVQSVPTEIRQLDLDAFRLELKSLEDDAAGMPFPVTHNHVSPITVGGVTLARVVEILNGYTVTFEDGQYAVNLVGANSNVGDVVNVNQVSIRSANSAGLTFSEQINDQSFIGAAVYVNSNSGLSGTSFPRGTPTSPVNNLTDALSIADIRSLQNVILTGFITANGTHTLDYHSFEAGAGASNVILLSGASTVNSSFNRLILVGAQNGLSRINSCILGVTGLGGFTEAEGRIVDSIINTVAGITQYTSGAGCLLDNCSFIAPDSPQIEFNANGKGFGMRSCTGNLIITNQTISEELELNFAGARVEIAPSCTAGTLNISGNATVVDNSGVGCTVVDNTLDVNQNTINEGVQKASLLIPHTTNL